MAEYSLLVDLGALGTCILEDINPVETEEGFTVVLDGHTSDGGIRVHGVIDNRTCIRYPCIWNNSILLNVENCK